MIRRKYLYAVIGALAVMLVAVGGYAVILTRRVAQAELDELRRLAEGDVRLVDEYIRTFRDALKEAGKSESFRFGDVQGQTRILNKLLRTHPSFLEVSVTDSQGEENMRMGRFLSPTPTLRDMSGSDVFLNADEAGFPGETGSFQGIYPTLTLGVPRPGGGTILAVLSLNGLTQRLHQAHIAPESALLAEPSGRLLAHSDRKLVFQRDASVPAEIVRRIRGGAPERWAGRITYGGKVRSAAYATSAESGWVSYVERF